MNPNTNSPASLDRLSWTEAADWFRRDPRLLLPVGSCIQHGPHLPLGTDMVIVERLSSDIAVRTGLLLAPMVSYGVAADTDRGYAGTASLDRKTLHRVLNELVDCWGQQGLGEIVLITTNGFARNIQALAAVVAETVRVRSIDTHALDLSQFLSQGNAPERGGELETSLMLHLEPDLVREEWILDSPGTLRPGADSTVSAPMPGSPGVVGLPSLASREKGRRIYEHMVETISTRLEI
ncbi:MAG: creatininase family protein [marine benthic group bacterium]|nr:creatininase family protein [Candidatus Carthagonibacter metallireducens]